MADMGEESLISGLWYYLAWKDFIRTNLEYWEPLLTCNLTILID